MSYTIVTDSPLYPANVSYQIINLTANIVLSFPSSFAGGNIVAAFNKIIPDANGWTVTLPDATLASPGTEMRFYNPSVYSFNLLANNSTLISEVPAGGIIDIVLSDPSTAAGLWDIFAFGGGVSNIASFDITSSNSSITVTGGAVEPPGGTVDLTLPPSLTDLALLNETGIVFITSTDPVTWDTGAIIGGDNITVTQSGILNNFPAVNLNSNLAALTSIQVGEFYINGSTLEADTSDTDITFSTSGTGILNLNGVIIDSSGNMTVAEGMRSTFLPTGYTTFTDTLTGSTNTIVQQDSGNVASITGNAGNYVVNFTNSLATATYAVFFGFGSTGDPTPLVYNGVAMVKETTSVTISVTNMSGALITDAPYGISVLIMGGN